MSASNEHPPEHQPTIEQVFKEFGEPDYFISPHKKFGRKVFKHLWALSVVMLILTYILYVPLGSFSKFWEYRRLFYQYHTLYQDGLITFNNLDDIEWYIFYELNMDSLTDYLTHKDVDVLELPGIDEQILDNPEEQFCFYSSLSDCYWEFYYEVMVEDGDFAKETAIHAVYHLHKAGFISDPEIIRLNNSIRQQGPISETLSLEIQALFIRYFLEVSQVQSSDNDGQTPLGDENKPQSSENDGVETSNVDIMHDAESHQLKKISSFIIHILDRFLSTVVIFAFMLMTIFWNRAFFSIFTQAPATFIQLASNGRFRRPALENINIPPAERVSLKERVKSKPCWKSFIAGPLDKASEWLKQRWIRVKEWVARKPCWKSCIAGPLDKASEWLKQRWLRVKEWVTSKPCWKDCVASPFKSASQGLKRQRKLGKQLVTSKPRWQKYAADLLDNASGLWSFLFYGIWLFFFYAVSYWGMGLSDFLSYLGDVEFILGVVISVIAVYVYGSQFWVLFVIARYLRMLPGVFDLDINFKHYDRRGGLGRIGDLIFKMGMIYVMPAIFIAVFLTYIISRSTTEVIESFIILSRFNWVLSVIVLGAVVLLVLANLTFFLPLFGIHKQMVLKKFEYEDNALNLVRQLDEKLEKALIADKPTKSEIENFEKALEAVKLMYPADIHLSTWPISSYTFISFLTTQVVPIVSLIGAVISLFS